LDEESASAAACALNTTNNLGLIYKGQGRMVEAEEIYVRTLRGYEKAWRLEHT
jgi:tetratricopeptide (TPR) repeat protein